MPAAQLDSLQRHPMVRRLVLALAERPGVTVRVEPSMRRAAVLLTMRARDDGEPELLMIKRSDFEGDPWSGHIAFPGGRMEPEDDDLAMTAVRETREETGVDVALDGRLLGCLDELCPRNPHLPRLVIRPYVALVRADVRILPSREVADAFWVPLSALRTAHAWGLGTVSVRGGERTVSVFRHGGHVVWGLTERVLRQFLEYLGEPPVEPES
ncbi:MAG: hydrolase [Gemmatimonadetes bacterium]|jgi:8-oxo-dGTP pyrophosphatase MutT (NUDIX family)|nr:hydrolase [Gemmatimonadota bacterium]